MNKLRWTFINANIDNSFMHTKYFSVISTHNPPVGIASSL